MKDFISKNLKKEIYLRDVARRWKSELNTDRKVYVLSPYITSKAEHILENTKHCELYTVFDIENFINGSSSLKTLKVLYKKGFQIYSIPQLHAKIILVSETFLSIGSQNLTNQGTKSREATFISKNPEIVKYVENELKENWFPERKPITFEMIEDVENTIKPLINKFKKLKKEIKKFDEELIEEQKQREIEAERKKQELAEIEQQKEFERQRELERERKQRQLEANLREIRKTKEIIEGRVVELSSCICTFMPKFKDENLLEWRIDDEIFSLEKTKRYLSLIENNGNLAWARVMKSRITKYEFGISWTNPIKLNDTEYNISFMANRNYETIKDYNLIVKLFESEIPDNSLELYLWFDLQRVEVFKTENNNIENLENWMLENKSFFNEEILKKLLQTFMYKEKLTGKDAENFLKIKTKYELRLGRINEESLLIFKEI